MEDLDYEVWARKDVGDCDWKKHSSVRVAAFQYLLDAIDYAKSLAGHGCVLTGPYNLHTRYFVDDKGEKSICEAAKRPI